MRDTKFLLLALALEEMTQGQLNRLVADINELFTKYSRNGQITDTVALNKEVGELVDSFYGEFVGNLKDTAKKVGDLQARNAIEKVIPLLAKAGLYKEAVDLYREIKNYGDDVAKRLMVNGWSGQRLDYTIKTIKAGTQKTVQDIIVNGVSEGKGARVIAKDIMQYVRPVGDITTIKPFDEYRKRFGRPKNYTVNGRPAGSMQYNALRIARTETAHIYRQATLDFYEDKEYATGYRWLLSNRHPKYDICDENARRTYDSRDEIPRQHPNCLCLIQPIIMTRQELVALRKSKYGTPTEAYATAMGGI